MQGIITVKLFSFRNGSILDDDDDDIEDMEDEIFGNPAKVIRYTHF